MGIYFARSRTPEHAARVLWVVEHEREQVRMAHLGQVYFASVRLHIAQGGGLLDAVLDGVGASERLVLDDG